MVIHSRFKDYKVHMEPDFGFLEGLLGTPNTEFVIDEKVYGLYREYPGVCPGFRVIRRAFCSLQPLILSCQIV